MVASADSVGELYAAEKDPDGFLYILYADSWRPDLGKAAEPYLTDTELDNLLEDRSLALPLFFCPPRSLGARGTACRA